MPVAPQAVLQQRGPVFQVAISPAAAIAQSLTASGVAVPAPVIGDALVDTGASVTCIDNAAAAQLGLNPINVVLMHSATHSAQPTNVYAVRFEIVGAEINASAVQVLGAELAAQNLVMLIGRDLLQQATLHYNGLTGQFTIAI